MSGDGWAREHDDVLRRNSASEIRFVLDVLLIASGAAFFLLTAGYAALCDRL